MDTDENQRERRAPKHVHWRGRWVVAGAGALICLGLFLFMKPKEPRFQDKSLSGWLAQLDTGRFNAVDFNPVLDKETAAAIKQIGEPAIPFLIKRLKAALAAERTYNRLQDWPTKLPFKLVQSRLEKRIALGGEAVMGFTALGEDGKGAIPDLNAMASGHEVQLIGLFRAMAAAGPTSLNVFSNALQSSDYWIRGCATKAAGYLGRAGSSLVPQLIGILETPKKGWTESLSAARSLGRIREPSEVIFPALRRALLSTNDSVAGNAAFSLMLMGDAGRDAIPDIEARLTTNTGPAHLFMIFSLIVLSTNDARLVATLEQLEARAQSKDSQRKSGVGKQLTPRETIAYIRQVWTNCDAQMRIEAFSMLRDLVPKKE